MYGPVCGCGGPSWTKLVDLDMSDTTQTCPTSSWRLANTSSVSACGRTAPGCQSATFPAQGKSYTRVCGQVNGIQFGNPDGFNAHNPWVEGRYVDGVSITHGNPRQHIWTFVWDGEGCSSISTCCRFNNPPWFCTSLPDSTTDDLEVRICGDKTTAHEDTLITRLELYVKQLATLYDFNE